MRADGPKERPTAVLSVQLSGRAVGRWDNIGISIRIVHSPWGPGLRCRRGPGLTHPKEKRRESLGEFVT